MLGEEIRLTGVRMSANRLANHPIEHIEAVTDGLQIWSVPDVIALLEIGRKFYVEDSAGNKAYVEPVYPTGGLLSFCKNAYIKTRPDGAVTDNLLALPGGPLYRGGLFGAKIGR